jgi:Lar family restriction alleviation protein
MVTEEQVLSLLPCPFCGDDVNLHQVTGSYLFWSLSCDTCHVEMRSSTNVNWPSTECFSQDRKNKLLTAWNTRYLNGNMLCQPITVVNEISFPEMTSNGHVQN